jgi:DNA-binding GntR family transcriptional regulator
VYANEILPKRIADAAAEHDAIIRALRAGDPESARRAVETNYGHGTAELTHVIEGPEAGDHASHARPLPPLTLARKRSDER